MCIWFVLQEEMQKAAFEALQLQRDSVHGYIRNQVDITDYVYISIYIYSVGRSLYNLVECSAIEG